MQSVRPHHLIKRPPLPVTINTTLRPPITLSGQQSRISSQQQTLQPSSTLPRCQPHRHRKTSQYSLPIPSTHSPQPRRIQVRIEVSGHREGIVGRGGGHQDQELITPVARNQVGRPGYRAQDRRDLAQRVVPGEMPMLIIDQLESVEIGNQQRDRLPPRRCRNQRLVRAVVPGRPVEQPGQPVQTLVAYRCSAGGAAGKCAVITPRVTCTTAAKQFHEHAVPPSRSMRTSYRCPDGRYSIANRPRADCTDGRRRSSGWHTSTRTVEPC